MPAGRGIHIPPIRKRAPLKERSKQKIALASIST
jgi:hypothetical protein